MLFTKCAFGNILPSLTVIENKNAQNASVYAVF